MKNIDKFAEFCKNHIFDKEPELKKTHNVEIIENIRKDYSTTKALIIKENNSDDFQVLDLETSFYLCRGNADKALDNIITNYKRRAPDKEILSFSDNFDSVRDKIFIKLVNMEKNLEFLKDCVFVMYGEFAITFYFEINFGEWDTYLVPIKNYHAKCWQTSSWDLLGIAKNNVLQRHIFTWVNVRDMFSNMKPVEESSMPSMYVMSTVNRQYGASAMVCTEEIHKFAEKQNANIFILPCNVNEIMLVPELSFIDLEKLKTVLRGLNERNFDENDILSDNIYYYNKNTKQLVNWDKKEPYVPEDGRLYI